VSFVLILQPEFSIVTGGSKGIGKALVETRPGSPAAHSVLSLSRTDGSLAKGQQPHAYLDVSQDGLSREINAILATIPAKPIDVLINNAGVNYGKTLLEQTDEQVFLCAQKALPFLWSCPETKMYISPLPNVLFSLHSHFFSRSTL
jgi:NAD(P)-dependent dehydrogenase (short-subunit alcohol dehydrogenase family)